MGVVTVSRQYGAGGLRVARALAEALGFRLVDREIVEDAAKQLGLDPEVVRSRDERAPDLIETIGMALAGAPSIGGGPPPPMPDPALDDATLAAATRIVISTLADAGSYVILGRGGQAALRDRADACHISLIGELSDRVNRVAGWQHVDDREALARCNRFDSERAAYVRRFYGLNIREPALYDCVLNTSRLSLEDATTVAITAAERKLRAA